MIEPVKYARKPFEVDAVRVTAENMAEVATWCRGEVSLEGELPQQTQHIKIEVNNAINERQTMAFVGDWVLKAGKGFKIYTAKAFNKSFVKVDGVAKDAAVQASKGDLEELRTVTS